MRSAPIFKHRNYHTILYANTSYSRMAEADMSEEAAQIKRYLSGLDFPAQKREIIMHARNQGMPQPLITRIEGCPEREYTDPMDVARAMGIA